MRWIYYLLIHVPLCSSIFFSFGFPLDFSNPNTAGQYPIKPQETPTPPGTKSRTHLGLVLAVEVVVLGPEAELCRDVDDRERLDGIGDVDVRRHRRCHVQPPDRRARHLQQQRWRRLCEDSAESRDNLVVAGSKLKHWKWIKSKRNKAHREKHSVYYASIDKHVTISVHFITW